MMLKTIIKSTYIYSFVHRIYRKIKHKPIVGNNNVISKIFNSKIEFDIIGSNNSIIIDKSAQIFAKIYIRGNNHRIIIGRNVRIKNGILWLEDNDGLIHIDDNSTIESAQIAVTEPYKSIKIGKTCMLSTDIEIRTGDSHSIIDIEKSKRINYAKDIIIEDHVWIGSSTSILKGSYIEKNAVIGTRSVVTSRILKNTLAVGIPAKSIKININWMRERIYDI